MLSVIISNPEKLIPYIKYKEWLKTAIPGDKFIYYKGLSPKESYIFTHVASLIYRDAKAGIVYLTQKRQGAYNFDYIAIKASHEPKKELVPNHNFGNR